MKRLVADGWMVAMLDRDAAGLAAVSEEIADRSSVHVVDLVDPEQIRETVAQIVSRYGDIGALVNVAGAVRGGTAIATSDEDWQWNLDTNASSAFFLCRELLPHLVGRGGGAIVNFSSLTALRPIPERAAYAAAKGAVIAFTRQLAFEYGPDAVTVNTICPGAIRTPLLAARIDTDPSIEDELTARIPLRRLGEPEELAELVELLVSGRCGYLTGQTFVVDGGLGIA